MAKTKEMQINDRVNQIRSYFDEIEKLVFEGLTESKKLIICNDLDESRLLLQEIRRLANG